MKTLSSGMQECHLISFFCRITTPALLPSGPVSGYPSLTNLDLFPPKIVVSNPTAPRSRSVAQHSGVGELSFDQEVKNLKTDEESTTSCKETKEVDMITDNIDVQDRGTGTSKNKSFLFFGQVVFIVLLCSRCGNVQNLLVVFLVGAC